jgi:DNA-binding transcriptional ArsR family regulator
VHRTAVTLYQTLQNPGLVQALAHPLRARMLGILQEREASPKELAAEFGIPLANVAYHIQVLRKLKLIRLVKKTPRRGAVEHHYKADQAAHIDNTAWSQTPALIRKSMVGAALDEVGGYVMDAAEAGGFEHPDAHLSRSRLVLDQEAWDELGGMLKDALDRGYELEKEAAKRLKRSDHAGERRTGMVMMLFETMPGVPEPDAAKQAYPSKSRSSAKTGGRASRA